jgi:hypothetical protein
MKVIRHMTIYHFQYFEEVYLFKGCTFGRAIWLPYLALGTFGCVNIRFDDLLILRFHLF